MSKMKSLSFNPRDFARQNAAERQSNLESIVVREILKHCGVDDTPRLKRKTTESSDGLNVLSCAWLNTFMPVKFATKKFDSGRTFPVAISQLWRITERKTTPELLALQDLVDTFSLDMCALVTKYKDGHTLWVYAFGDVAQTAPKTHLSVQGAIRSTSIHGDRAVMVVEFNEYMELLTRSWRIHLPREML